MNNIQKQFQNCVGLLLYLTNHSQPTLLNTLCEMSKYTEESNVKHYKSLLFLIKYVIEMKHYCYHMKQGVNLNVPYKIRSYSGADYAGNNDTRIIVTFVFVLTIILFITCCSKSQKTVTSLVTESEYSAAVDVC